MERRIFLKSVLSGGAFAFIAGLLPHTVLAEWPEAAKKAFEAKSTDDVLNALFESSTTEESDKIVLEAPEIAENGAVVEIKVTVDLPKVESISLIAENNPVPLIAQFNYGEGAEGYVNTRIKMAASGDVIAVVKADGKLYAARKPVKVTVGGCGG